MKKVLSIFAVLSLLSAFNIAFTQNAKMFVGTWKFNADKSNPVTYLTKQVKIYKRRDTLFLERLESNDTTVIEPVLFDGRKFQCVTSSGRKKTGEANWLNDKRAFVEQAELYNVEDSTKIDFLVTETWSLSDDGKELTLVTLLSVGGQIMNTKAVYDKQ